MAGFKTMSDMKRTDAEKAESMIASCCPMPMMEDYPYGLKICLTEDELKKLDLDSSCEPGDMIHLRAMAVVTSKTETTTNGETTCRIELTLAYMSVESEDEEADEADAEDKPSKAERRYGNSTDDADEEDE